MTGHPARMSPAMRLAWMYVILLLPVGALNYFDRQMMASMKFSMMESIPEIGNDANWGFILGLFKWVYAFLSPIGGYIADRFSRRWTICGSLFVWSAVTWWTGHVGGYTELLCARALMGVSEAFYIPAALALIADYHRGPTRSRAVGLHQMAIYLGVIGGGFSGFVADNDQLGWRFAFWAAGLFGVIYAFPLVWLLRDVPRDDTDLAGLASRPSFWGSTSQLLRNPAFLLLVACFTLPAMAGWIVRDWMPAILKERFDVSQGVAGVTATLSYQIPAMFGAVIGGFLADRWVQTNTRGRTFISAIGMALFIPSIFGIGNAPSLVVAALFLTIFGFGWGFFDCNNMPILCQIARPELRATGYGIMNLVSISFGGLADWGFGALKDQNIPPNIIFGLLSLAAGLSGVLMLLIRPKPELASR